MLYPGYGDDVRDVLWGTVRADGVAAHARFVDLALHGCSVETRRALNLRSEATLMLAVPGIPRPVVVERGIVRSVDGGRVWVEFVRMSAADRALYRRFVVDRLGPLEPTAQA